MIELAYQMALSRQPSGTEQQNARAFLKNFTPAIAEDIGNRDRIRASALTGFCQALFASAEFRYLN